MEVTSQNKAMTPSAWHANIVDNWANCQAGVFLGYASRKGYTLLDRRLYLSEEWIEQEAYQARRQQCGVPKEITHRARRVINLLAGKIVAGTHEGPWRKYRAISGRNEAITGLVNKTNVSST